MRAVFRDRLPGVRDQFKYLHAPLISGEKIF
jgi:hypothetical protein